MRKRRKFYGKRFRPVRRSFKRRGKRYSNVVRMSRGGIRL